MKLLAEKLGGEVTATLTGNCLAVTLNLYADLSLNGRRSGYGLHCVNIFDTLIEAYYTEEKWNGSTFKTSIVL